MDKINFDDGFGLTDMVLSGEKTQIRMIIKERDERLDYPRGRNSLGFWEFGRIGEEPFMLLPRFYVGEELAVAQSYKDIYNQLDKDKQESFLDTLRNTYWSILGGDITENIRWNDKTNTRTYFMLHAVKITKIRFERLQYISEADCLKEGVLGSAKYVTPYGIVQKNTHKWVFFFYSTPREAYAALIDGIYGIGTWESNPYVFVYDFELVK